MNCLTRFIARALDPSECEFVLGDLAECGSSGRRTLFDVIGLVMTHQLLIWTSWRPWFALIGIVGVSGFCLSGMVTRLKRVLHVVFHGRHLATWPGQARHLGDHLGRVRDVDQQSPRVHQ